jgi:hypothetical protein
MNRMVFYVLPSLSWLIGKDLKGRGGNGTGILSQYLHRGPEENNEHFGLRERVSRAKLEPAGCRMRVYNPFVHDSDPVQVSTPRPTVSSVTRASLLLLKSTSALLGSILPRLHGPLLN